MIAMENFMFCSLKIEGEKSMGEKQLRTFNLWTIKHFCELGKGLQQLI